MIVAVACRKASPGVTSLTALLAQLWDEPDVVRLVVEADPSGGTLAARWSTAHGLTWEPGLLSLSTSRVALTAASLPFVSQQLAEGLFVAASPPVPDQVGAALDRWGDRGAAELAAAPWLRAFVDCGRLGPRSPAMILARRAALTILVCRPRLDEVSAMVASVPELTSAGLTLALVCIGDGPYPPMEVAATAGIPLLGVIPTDPRAAAAFDRDGVDAGRRYWRSPMVRTGLELAEVILARTAGVLAPPLSEPAPPAAAPAPTDPLDDLRARTPAGTQHRVPSRNLAPDAVAHPDPITVSPAIEAARAQARARRSGGSGSGGNRTPASSELEDREATR